MAEDTVALTPRCSLVGVGNSLKALNVEVSTLDHAGSISSSRSLQMFGCSAALHDTFHFPRSVVQRHGSQRYTPGIFLIFSINESSSLNLASIAGTSTPTRAMLRWLERKALCAFKKWPKRFGLVYFRESGMNFGLVDLSRAL